MASPLPALAGLGGAVGGPTQQDEQRKGAVSKTDTKTETEWQELLDFINLWQLDQACADYLVTQTPEIQKEAIENFRPKPGTANVSGLFMGYVNSLNRAQKGGKGIGIR
ncbi:Ubiquinol oxidase 1a [Durusdinium trenchii]|uniref:Mitochondrial n=1 Tax=Durusdinium trenchii TaxID=1381693 RepID=A0ABP0K5I2_9DINO